MSVSEQYAQFLKDSCYYPSAGKRNLEEYNYLVLGLAGEAGETADNHKKVLRETGLNEKAFQRRMDGKEQAKILNELGDELYYLTQLAKYFDTTIEGLMVINAFKLYTRHTEITPEKPDAHQFTKEELPWPFPDIPYSDVSKLMQAIESRTTEANASTSTATDMLLKL